MILFATCSVERLGIYTFNAGYQACGRGGTGLGGALAVNGEFFQSIHDLPPLEQGGSTARRGFAYQDHVSASFCIDMLTDSSLAEVWCETEDDVVLIWNNLGEPCVEFVQVKSDAPAQLWSVAMLCAGGPGSIAAKSLAHDRCAEPCCFRIVTRADIHPELRPLQLPLVHSDRSLGTRSMISLHRKVCTALKDAVSPRGRSASLWLADTFWEISGSLPAIENQNLLKLHKFVEDIDEALFSDQVRELYDRILRRVQSAASMDWLHSKSNKKIKSLDFRYWIISSIEYVKGQLPAKAGTNLKKKMAAALIPPNEIENAGRLRLAYRRRRLASTYQSEENLNDIDLEVTATLQKLLSDLDAGNLVDDGLQFHARCLHALSEIRVRFPHARLSDLQGALYSATDRCRHRFLAASL